MGKTPSATKPKPRGIASLKLTVAFTTPREWSAPIPSMMIQADQAARDRIVEIRAKSVRTASRILVITRNRRLFCSFRNLVNSLARDAESLTDLRERHTFSAKATNFLVSLSSLMRTGPKRTPLPAGQLLKHGSPTSGEEAVTPPLTLRRTPRSKGNSPTLKHLAVPGRNASGTRSLRVLLEGRKVVVPPGIETSGDFSVIAHVLSLRRCGNQLEDHMSVVSGSPGYQGLRSPVSLSNPGASSMKSPGPSTPSRFV